MIGAPGYWMHETSGILRPAIVAYFHGCMTPEHVAAMRAYLRQWIMHPGWQGDADLTGLRARIDGLVDRDAIRRWLADALALGIDPL